MRIKKSVCVLALFSVEIFVAYCYRNQLLDFFSVLNNESLNFFDDIFIGIIGSILFSLLQFINLFFIEKLAFYSKKSFILFFQKIFRCNISALKSTINDMMKFVFKANKKWGVYQKSESTKIANTSEGILACVYAASSGYELTPEERKELCLIIDKMLDELDENGFKSYNENTFTVHCTAMGAFAIKKAVDLDLYEIQEESEEKIRSCMKKLLRNANEEGWGFKNEYTLEKGYNRALSTIWAFRALNVWGFSGNKQYVELLGNFVGHTEGVIGFSKNNTAKSSSTALLYIFLNEIENSKTKKILSRKINSNKMLDFLIKNLKNEIEVEEFIISLQDTKKLPWTHLSECLSLEAISFFLDELSFFQIGKVLYYLKRVLKKVNVTHHYYVAELMNFNHDNPFFYPTTYLIMALSDMVNQMECID